MLKVWVVWISWKLESSLAKLDFLKKILKLNWNHNQDENLALMIEFKRWHCQGQSWTMMQDLYSWLLLLFFLLLLFVNQKNFFFVLDKHLRLTHNTHPLFKIYNRLFFYRSLFSFSSGCLSFFWLSSRKKPESLLTPDQQVFEHKIY